MKYLLFFAALISFLSCGTDYVEDPQATQRMLDSLVNYNTYTSSFVTTDGQNFQKRIVTFTFGGDTSMTVSTGGCPMEYELYDGGSKGATVSEAWNSDGYVDRVNIQVERIASRISSIQLNNHLFTNSPVPVAQEVVVSKVRTYKIVKGDNATKLGKFIPKDKIPAKIIIGQTIHY